MPAPTPFDVASHCGYIAATRIGAIVDGNGLRVMTSPDGGGQRMAAEGRR